MLQFDKFLSLIFLLMSLLENAISPWGQLGKGFAQAQVHTKFIARVLKARD